MKGLKTVFKSIIGIDTDDVQDHNEGNEDGSSPVTRKFLSKFELEDDE